MTIKYRDKNISAEKEGVVVNASLDKGTGILTLSLKNQHDDTTLPPIQLQLHDISLNIVKKNRAYIEELTETTDEEKIIERASTLFLVPLDDDEENPDAYQELVWSEDKGEFENVGTTRIDLKPIQEDITQLQTVLDIEIINNIVKSNVLETIENDINDLREVKQNKNIVTSWSNPLSDFKYPSEKLTKDSLDTKINKTDIADDLTINNSNKVLSAKQGKKLQDDKQDKTDNTLSTNTKTVVGAINELNSYVNDLFNNSDFKQAYITVTRDGVTSKETWLLVNARYDETENKFYKIDKNEKAFGIQFQASGTYPGEENVDQNNQAIGVWRCPSQSELIATFGQQTVEEMIPNGEIGWSFDNGQTWTTFGVMAGWNNIVMFDSYGGFTVGGHGIEVDGNGIFPYMRLTSSKYTINNEDVYLYGIIINAYHNASGVDNTDRAWFFGIKAPQKKDSNNNLVTNTSNLSQGTFIVLYNDTADTSWNSSAWTELKLNNLITVAGTVADGNTNPVSSDAVYDAIPKETITLTVNYTDGSPSEDIEFYIK